MQATIVRAFGQNIVFPVTRRPISYSLLGFKFPEESISHLKYVGASYYQGIDGVSYPDTATSTPTARISAPVNREFHLLFIPAYKLSSMIAKNLTYEISVRYYEAVIVFDDKFYVPCNVPKKIHVAGSAGSRGEDPEEGNLEDAFGGTPFTYLYNVPWGAFYINRPEVDMHAIGKVVKVEGDVMEVELERKEEDRWEDMIVSWPPF